MRRLLVLASAMIFFDVAFFAAIAPLLPDYVDELGLSKAEAGILSAAYAAGTLLASLPAGLARQPGRARGARSSPGCCCSASPASSSASAKQIVAARRRPLQSRGSPGALIWSGRAHLADHDRAARSAAAR